jgi:hypothetical protein
MIWVVLPAYNEEAADNTHPPAFIPVLVDRVRLGFDVAIASRYRPGAEVHGVPGYRRALSDIVLDYGERVGQSKMKVPRTIRSTVGLLMRRRLERMTRYTSARIEARIASAESHRVRPS